MFPSKEIWELERALCHLASALWPGNYFSRLFLLPHFSPSFLSFFSFYFPLYFYTVNLLVCAWPRGWKSSKLSALGALSLFWPATLLCGRSFLSWVMYKSRIWCVTSCLVQLGERGVTGRLRTKYYAFQHVLFACISDVCVCAGPRADVGVRTPVWMDGEAEDQPWLSSVAVYLALLSQGLSLAYSLQGSLFQLLSEPQGWTISLSLALGS